MRSAVDLEHSGEFDTEPNERKVKSEKLYRWEGLTNGFFF